MTDVYNSKRSPLIWKEGDHVYIVHPYSQKPKKLKPRTRGPYKVKEVTLHPKTNDVVSVSVDITPPGQHKKIYKRYPRRHLLPIRSRLPTIDWKNWPDCGDIKDNASDWTESLKIKETPDGKPAYVVLEAEA